MKSIDQFVDQPAEWLKASGPFNDVVVSSRMRLARNLTGYPFERNLTEQQRREIIEVIRQTLAESDLAKNTGYFSMQELSELDRQLLLERHLISREHAEDPGTKSVALSDDEAISLMVLEEDHLRMQSFQSGLNLIEAWRIVDRIDTEIEKRVQFAFSPVLGYLTACPTNVGTGLRASCMLHLPGLVLTKQIHKILQALGKLNLAVRGLYGEGTQATGNLFQFSNQITLGQNEEEIIENLECVIKQVVDHEKTAREHLMAKKKAKFDDQVWRAIGALKSARVMSSQEATGYLSLLQLGFNLDMFKADLTRKDLNSLFLLIQPAHLQKKAGKELDAVERDVRRAELIRNHLKKITL